MLAVRAIQWLERARQKRDPGLFQLYRSVFFRPIHQDPRWAAFWNSFGVQPPGEA